MPLRTLPRPRSLSATPRPRGTRILQGAATLATAALLATVTPASARGDADPTFQASDSAAVAATVQRFHDALAAGDSATALSLLTDDVVILESGGRETKTQYREGHLRGDIAFARAVKSERGPAVVTVRGDVAWVTGTSTTAGEYNGRTINSAGAELMVLVRTPAGWRIAAIHWSSRQRRPS